MVSPKQQPSLEKSKIARMIPFPGPETQTFLEKMETLKGMEQIADAIGFVYSRGGFTMPTPR